MRSASGCKLSVWLRGMKQRVLYRRSARPRARRKVRREASFRISIPQSPGFYLYSRRAFGGMAKGAGHASEEQINEGSGERCQSLLAQS